MPPKKTESKGPSKQNDRSQDLNKTPTNICDFVISMECKHEAGHYLKVKFNWINVAYTNEASEITYPVTDTGHLKDWTLYQIEGEEPVAQEELDPKAKAVAAKKPDPKKGAGKLEEIVDNRARTVKYELDMAAENNGNGFEVTEEIAYAWTDFKLNL